MVWDLFRTKKVKPAAAKSDYWRTFWRRVRDSNPRSLSEHSISSAAPSTTRTTLQDLSQHQDLRKRGELMGRTEKNIKLRIPEKPRKIKGFRLGGYRIATTISSQPRYDHIDTSPCCISNAFRVSRRLNRKQKMLEKRRKTIDIKLKSRKVKRSVAIRGFRRRGICRPDRSPVMTASIPRPVRSSAGKKKRKAAALRGGLLSWRRHPDSNWRIADLQSAALPLGYGAKKMERATRFELATSTLARWRSAK